MMMKWKILKVLSRGEQYPPLKIVEPLEKRTTGKHHTISFKNNWASDKGEPRDWIKEIQDEINYLRMKGIDVNEVFSLLVKIMKNVKPCVDLTSTKKNWRDGKKISSHRWAGGGDCWVHVDTKVQPIPKCSFNELMFLWLSSHVKLNSPSSIRNPNIPRKRCEVVDLLYKVRSGCRIEVC